MSAHEPAPIPSGRETIAGVDYMRDAKGALVPLSVVKPMDQLIDEAARKIVGYAIALSAQMARFKAHTFDDIGALDALLLQDYGAVTGGAKGNKTLITYDGLFKVQVQVADRITFGPELQVAKTLLDECLNEWSSDARPELRAIVTRAFNTDREGQINRSEIFTLLRLEIADSRWQQAMRAIRDAMRIEGSQVYVRAYQRAHADAPWDPITLDLAKV